MVWYMKTKTSVFVILMLCYHIIAEAVVCDVKYSRYEFLTYFHKLQDMNYTEDQLLDYFYPLPLYKYIFVSSVER